MTPEYLYASETPLDKEECVIRIPSFPIPGDHEDRWMRSSQIANAVHKAFGGERRFDFVYIYTIGVAYFEGVKVAKSLRIPRNISIIISAACRVG